MKTRNNSSKAFHNHQTPVENIKSFQYLVDVIISKIDSKKSERLAINAFKEIIQRCYNNRQAQKQLCKTLNVPFFPGPVTLNSLPNSFFQQEYLSQENIQESIMNQISYLFQYLKKTKEYFYCWIIYYNQQLKLLTVKMMKKYQLKENIELLNSKYCMIGIFVDRQVNLNLKKQAKYSFIKEDKIGTQLQKTTAYSCYQNMSSPELLKKPKNRIKKSQMFARNTQNSFSMKTFNSASVTNSSSFKNSLSQKQAQNHEDNFQQSSNIKLNQKIRNFKRKKEKLLLFGEIKIRKSISTKNEKSRSNLKVFKSLDKIQFISKNNPFENVKSKQKLHCFRSLSNAEKLETYKKIDANKIQFHKIEKNSDIEKKQTKSNSLSKFRKLSKNDKLFNSSESLNSSSQSQNHELNTINEKSMPNFRRKISANQTNFKKKKMDQIKFVNSSKNSFQSK